MDEWKKLWNAIGKTVVVMFVAAVILGGIALLCKLDYDAYRQRFPNAAPWTYFFQGNRQ